MFEIIGTSNDIHQEYIGESFVDHYSDEVIATFDLEKDAFKYIEDSKLKQVKRRCYASEVVFKSKSMLSGCVSARVEGHYPEEIPHNPVF